jgi:hypothetical protein
MLFAACIRETRNTRPVLTLCGTTTTMVMHLGNGREGRVQPGEMEVHPMLGRWGKREGEVVENSSAGLRWNQLKAKISGKVKSRHSNARCQEAKDGMAAWMVVMQT